MITWILGAVIAVEVLLIAVLCCQISYWHSKYLTASKGCDALMESKRFTLDQLSSANAANDALNRELKSAVEVRDRLQKNVSHLEKENSDLRQTIMDAKNILLEG